METYGEEWNNQVPLIGSRWTFRYCKVSLCSQVVYSFRNIDGWTFGLAALSLSLSLDFGKWQAWGVCCRAFCVKVKEEWTELTD